jgi:ubiquinone/menaquinone biosynthesis C-methylase UbiE
MSLAPFVPSPLSVVVEMLQLVELKTDEVLFDLGCGDGRIIMEAAQNFGARAVGVELDEGRYKICVDKVKDAHLESRVKIIHGNLLDVDLTSADVVTLYLLTSSNEKVKPNLERDLRKGARVVSHDFKIKGWTPSKVKTIDEEWEMPNIFAFEELEFGFVPYAEIILPYQSLIHKLYLYTL